MAQKARFAKACQAMKGYGISEETVNPVLITLLDLYDKNWKHIEDENYRVLLDAIFDTAAPKREEETRTQEYRLLDEPEECEPPPLKKRLRSQKDVSSPSPCGGLSPNISRSPTPSGGSPSNSSVIPYKRKGKISSSPQKSEPPVPSFALSPNENVLDKSREEGTHFDDDGTPCEIPLAVVLPAHPSFLREDISSHKNFSDAQENRSEFPKLIHTDTKDKSHASPLGEGSSSHGKFSGAKGNFSQFPELIDLDSEDKSRQVGSTNEDFSNLKANALEILNPQLANEKEDDDPKSMNIDIASSLNGEVKISLIHNTSNQSDGRNRSINSVLKAVEEKCVKSYGITKPGFSLLNLMKDVCEFFLLDGTSSDCDEQVGPVNVQPTLDVTKTFDRKLVPLSFSNGSLKLQNLIQVLPHIPRSLTSTGFDFPKSIEGVNVNLDVFSVGRDKKSNTFVRRDSSSSKAMVIAQKQNSCYVDDITKGEEEKKISLVNEINDEHGPTFCYIPKNVRYQNAYVKFILARISDDNCCSGCSGDCTLRAIPCACAGETGGEFAYTTGGLVKEKFLEECISMNRDPQKHNLFYCKDCPLERSKGKSLSGKCKGHLVRRFIKECWYKCGCSYNCGNRIVQRGITVNLQVFMTAEGKGWGLRTLENLPKGAFVCEYVGEIVTNTELFERNKQNRGEKHTYPVLLDADWGSEGVLKDEEALCLDATFCGNVARFVNHRCCDANMVEIPVEVETPDHHYYHLAFFTTRKVHALEELTWDYGVDFDDHTHPVKAFQCCCGSKFCRNIKRRKRTRSS